MKTQSQTGLAAGFRQLGGIVDALENGGFKQNESFKVKANDSFSLVLNPDAVEFLKKKKNAEFMFIQYNPAFIYEYKTKQNTSNYGVEIHLTQI